VFTTLMYVLMSVVSISLLLAVVRLLMGPSIPDRTMALDMTLMHVVALIALYGIAVDRDVLVDAIIVTAVLGFLGTISIARYIEEGRS
jgi:multisubunit Na+/H+ antiporter MnhF subunit